MRARVVKACACNHSCSDYEIEHSSGDFFREEGGNRGTRIMLAPFSMSVVPFLSFIVAQIFPHKGASLSKSVLDRSKFFNLLYLPFSFSSTCTCTANFEYEEDDTFQRWRWIYSRRSLLEREKLNIGNFYD